jgi:guanylate kinase
MKKLVILTGESGSGKDSIQKMLGMNTVISHSTRPIRSGEQNGVQYHFITKEEFDKIEMVETREYHTLFNGNPDTWYYGVSVDEINSKVNATYITPCVILDIKGMTFMKHWCNEHRIETITFYIKVDKFTRTLRAIKRGSFSLKEWLRRLQDDKIEFHWAESWCDYTVKNYNLSNCVDEILSKVFGGKGE